MKYLDEYRNGDIAAKIVSEMRRIQTRPWILMEVCCRIRKSDGLDRVCLSGGVFQNHLLLGVTALELRRLGFGVFLHAMVPANDGGISLGQAVIANELLRRGD